MLFPAWNRPDLSLQLRSSSSWRSGLRSRVARAKPMYTRLRKMASTNQEREPNFRNEDTKALHVFLHDFSVREEAEIPNFLQSLKKFINFADGYSAYTENRLK
jgi:hypothetical protein